MIALRVPASTSNMGPGFDALGCAFMLYNRLTFSFAEEDVVTGGDPAFRNRDNLVLVGFREACRSVGIRPCSVSVKIDSEIPPSAGLGSSASLLTGGIEGANLLCRLAMSREDIFSLVSRLEGHPDNAAPAVFGGLTASLMNRDRCFSVSYPLAECWRFAAFVSDFTIQTRDSRSRLPAQISRSDAVFSSTRAALLPAALMGEDPALLSAVFCDRLHEPYRIPAIPDYPLLRELSLTLGAHAFFLSGSGPTCMAVYTEASFPEKASAAINALSEESRLRQKWRLLPLSVDREGLLRE